MLLLIGLEIVIKQKSDSDVYDNCISTNTGNVKIKNSKKKG